MEEKITLKQFCVNSGLALGFAEIRRSCNQGAVLVNENIVTDPDTMLKVGDVVKFGKHREVEVIEVLKLRL